MTKFLKGILSAPVTVWFNLRYLPFRQGIKLPVLVSYKTCLKIRGGVKIGAKSIRMGMIHIGFHDEPVINRKDTTCITVDGIMEFKGCAFFGKGTKIKVMKGAKLSIGDSTTITGNSSINCYNNIKLGERCRLSWDILIMDSDTHPIYNTAGEIMNYDRPIWISDHVWIGCRSTILKGSSIPSNCIVAAGSVITSGKKFRPNTIIAGAPPQSLRNIGYWK